MKKINNCMVWKYNYPRAPYDKEMPLKMAFYGAPYSLDKNFRTRPAIKRRAEEEGAFIVLPLPKDTGFSIAHEYGINNDNPVAPVITMAGIKNSGGVVNLLTRLAQPSLVFFEKFFATSTYRRFSNVTELTMVSEGRKQFYFEYIFTPKNPDESNQVENICGAFRKASYPTLASNLPERSYPQNLWVIDIIKGNQPQPWDGQYDAAELLGNPLPCVLKTVIVKRNDNIDPIVRFLPDGRSNVTLLGLKFEEFETGTYDPAFNEVISKSEIAAYHTTL